MALVRCVLLNLVPGYKKILALCCLSMAILLSETTRPEEPGVGNLGKTIVMEGDITLGVILSVNEREELVSCGDRLRETGAVQFVEAVIYAVRRVNADHDLLPHSTLGVVIVDDCTKAVTALARALHFLPVKKNNRKCYDTCSGDADERMTEPEASLLTFYDVVGVIGAESSPSSIIVAKLLGMFNIPQISPSATSDVLSDKKKFPYFMRMSSPDRYQVRAMSHLFKHFDWTYVAAVYSKGSYGEGGVEQLRKAAARLSICIGAELSIAQNPTPAAVNRIIATLVEARARVVVLFTDQEETRLILKVILNKDLVGRFVFVGSDGVGINLDDLDDVEEAALGALTLKSYSVEVPSFFKYFESLTPCNASYNPWFNEMWAELFHISHLHLPNSSEDRVTESSCSSGTEMSIRDAGDYSRESTVSLTMDTVYVFARAIDRLMRDHCPGTQSKDVIRSCIHGPRLLQYLRNTTFTGENGDIRFDENGDIRGRYEVMNFQRLPNGKYNAVRVGVWDTVTERLNINDSLIVWNLDPIGVAGSVAGMPVSKCGEECEVGEVYSYFKDTCCWECRRCAPNERTLLNATKCSPCPPFTWPSEDNFTTCYPIDPTFVVWKDPVLLLFLSLSVAGLAYCVFVGVVYVRHNKDRLIKSTSRELSYLMWVGVVLQYLLMFCVASKPSSVVCRMSYAGFNISFAVVYSPLLTRTNRIYRLFEGGIRGKALPSLTSPVSQVVIALAIVSVQVILSIVVVIAAPPEVEKRMPVATEAYIELTCAVSLSGFMASLSYNVLLVVICTYYAFKTRTLPDNFNESRYITFCVYTTLLIWLVFIPSYFTTLRVYQQTIVVSSALLLNATVTLLCLFTPKIYALYQGPGAINFKYNMDTGQGRLTGSSAASSAIHVSRSAPNLDQPSHQRLVRVEFVCPPPTNSAEASQTNGVKSSAVH